MLFCKQTADEAMSSSEEIKPLSIVELCLAEDIS